MICIEIDGLPVPWAAHKGYGRNSYSPRYKEKEHAQWQIKAYYNQKEPIEGPIRIYFEFHMPIPSGTSKVRKRQMLNGMLHHLKRPDTTNMQKHYEDCLKGIVIEDDSQVVEIHSKKIYGEKPKTVVKIEKVINHL